MNDETNFAVADDPNRLRPVVFPNQEQPYQENTITPLSKSRYFFSEKHISEQLYKINVYDNLLSVKKPDSFVKNDHHKCGIRGDVSEFSRTSRFRLFCLLSKMSIDYRSTPLFVSLTWHYGHMAHGFDPIYTCHHFLIQLRRAFPGIAYIWRLEFQQRGAPHFHLMLFPENSAQASAGSDIITFCSSEWHRLADPLSKAHETYGCKSEEITNYRKACAYLSKYIAKEDNELKNRYIGRRWGHSENINTPVQISAVMSQAQIDLLTRILRRWLQSRSPKKLTWFDMIARGSSFQIFLDRDTIEMLLNWVTERCPTYAPSIS